MSSEEKIIKQGLRVTDAWWRRFKKQVLHDLSLCSTWEEFLERTEAYTTNNVLVGSEYSSSMQNLVVQVLNDIRFQRASQRQLIEETIKNTVANLIVDVGEDIKSSVREVVSQGYDEGLGPRQIGSNISKRLDTIHSKRARTIARTEVKRADTIAKYVMAKNDGAVGFTVKCRPDCCRYCAKEYAEIDGTEYDKLTNEDGEPTNGGKLIGGEKEYSMDDTDILPPFHPNCRCTVYYIY